MTGLLVAATLEEKRDMDVKKKRPSESSPIYSLKPLVTTLPPI